MSNLGFRLNLSTDFENFFLRLPLIDFFFLIILMFHASMPTSTVLLRERELKGRGEILSLCSECTSLQSMPGLGFSQNLLLGRGESSFSSDILGREGLSTCLSTDWKLDFN